MVKSSLLIIVCAAMLGTCTSKKRNGPTREQLSGRIEVSQSRARPASSGTNSAAYLSIYNGTVKNDTLLGIESEFVSKAEIHESYTTEEGLSGMRPAGKLPIASGDSLILKPGGLHIMLMGTQKNFSAGDSLKVRLHFSQTGTKNLILFVKEF